MNHSQITPHPNTTVTMNKTGAPEVYLQSKIITTMQIFVKPIEGKNITIDPLYTH